MKDSITNVTIENQLSTMDKLRLEIGRKAEAEAAAIVAKQNELREIQAPLGRLLSQREEIVRRMAAGEAIQDVFARALKEYEPALDEIFSLGTNGGGVGAYLNILRIRPEQSAAERGLCEVTAFLDRRKAELANLDAKILEYARQNKLEYMLPTGLK